MNNDYTFKLITTGETVSLSYPSTLTVCEFLTKLRRIIKQKYNIDKFSLIEGGTNLGELGYEYNFNDCPTRITTIQELFKNTVSFYIKGL
jgi:hypothetical protein